MKRFAIALHGGAGASHSLSYDGHLAHMRGLLESARAMLENGERALDVAQSIVSEMEVCGLYVAGRGGSPNLSGEYELEACVMDGTSRRAGAVAALRGFRSPIAVARRVMQCTQHVLLVGAGAEAFAHAQGCVPIPDQDWFTNAGEGESNHPPDFLPHGTVGAAVLDSFGNLAAATSSAGLFGKQPGRVADSSLPGCGTWADEQIAVSCTGQGELFIQSAAAAQLAFHVKSCVALDWAADVVLADVLRGGGEGGLVAVDRTGRLALPYVAEGMKRGVLTVNGKIGVAVFDEPLPDLCGS